MACECLEVCTNIKLQNTYRKSSRTSVFTALTRHSGEIDGFSALIMNVYYDNKAAIRIQGGGLGELVGMTKMSLIKLHL